MDGVLIIDKPAGITSHDVVARVRRILKTRRIGHTGTLDPFATGVMVILVGKATRLAQFLDKDAKEYEAVVRFGFETDTGDLTGNLKFQVSGFKFQVSDSKTVSIEEIKSVLENFRGEIEQTPPMYSAKKVNGKKLYEFARKGIEIERKSVKVMIYELQITNYKLKEKTDNFGLWTLDFGLKVSCSAGTYIRTLAQDIGRKFGVGAHLAELRRTRAGKFEISNAVTLEELEKIVAAEKLGEILISMNEAVSHLPEIGLSAEEINKTKNGIKLEIESAEIADSGFCRMTKDTNLIAIGFYDAAEKIIQPKLVLV
ncbi:MAG: tRNA pseudouridine(55) synthase TruB [Acidobacteriota bacterium]|nr:tRNA pseudouridine(55) synthase TruB [Acidobacteriota bacterium]